MLNLYYIASNGLQIGQKALTVIGNNLVNSTNSSYNQQNIILGVAVGKMTPMGYIGNGARIEGISRVFDEYANEQLREKETLLKAFETHYSKMNALDVEFSRVEDGIDSKLNNLLNRMQEISKEPKNSYYRNNAFAALKELILSFKKMNNELIKHDIKNNDDIRHTVENINQLSSQLATLNREFISRKNTKGNELYDLLDKRDALLQSLSQQVGISTKIDQHTGAVSVILSDNYTLVYLDKISRLEVSLDRNNQNRLGISYCDSEHSIIPLQDDLIEKGILGGILSFRNQHLSKIRNQLNEIALYFSKRFNTLNNQGYDANDKKGKDIFSYLLPNAIASENNKGEARIFVEKLNTNQQIIINTGEIENKIARPLEYTLYFNKNKWHITCIDDGRKVESNYLNNKLIFDGVTLVIEGDPKEGDRYQLNPFNGIIDSIVLNIKDGNDIAASNEAILKNIDSKEKENNFNIIALSDIQNEKLINGDTIINAYARLVGYIGNTTRNLMEKTNLQEKLFQSSYAEHSRKTGVDLNQEYVKMEMFRQYYNASAHVMKTANTLLDILLTIY